MEQNVGIVRTFRDVLGPEWRGPLTQAIHSRCLHLALHYQRHGNKSKARQFARMAVRESAPGLLRSYRTAVKVFAYMHVPALPRLVKRYRGAVKARPHAEPAHQDNENLVPSHR